MIYPLLPVFLTSILGSSAAFLGIIEGIAESTSSLLKLISGAISDRIGKRKGIVILGYTISNLSRPVIGFAINVYHVLFLRFFDRLGKGIRSSPRDALLASSSPPEIMGKSFGFHRALDHMGAVIGPLTATIILATITNNLRNIFLLAGIPGFFAIFFAITFVKETPVRKEKNKNSPQKTNYRFSRKFKTFILIIILFSLGNSSDTFLILKAKETGIAIKLLPLLWLFHNAAKMIISIPAGILSDKIGRIKTIIPGWFIYFIVYIWLAFIKHPYEIWIVFLIYGLYFGFVEGAEKALISELVPKNLFGTAYGIYNFATGISYLPASIIFGLLWTKFGSTTAFLFGGFLAFVASILLLKFLYKSSKNKT